MMEEYFSLIDDKPSTLSRKEDAFSHLEEFFGGFTLNRITSNLVYSYKKKRRHGGAADSTILNEVRLLSHAFNTAGWTRENPQ
jgi:hypothetical protein